MGRAGRIHNLWLFDFVADFAAVTAAYYTTLEVRFHSDWGGRFFTWINQFLGVRETGLIGPGREDFYYTHALRIILQLTVVLCVAYALRDLYAGLRFVKRRPIGWNVLVANVLALAIFYAYFYLSRNVFHPRSFFATMLLVNVFYCVLFRSAMARFLEFLRQRRGLGRHGAVLLGRGEEADLIAGLIEAVHPHGIDVVARIPAGPETSRADYVAAVAQAVSQHDADMVISADRNLSVSEIMRLLEAADRLDVTVKVLSRELDVLVEQARLPVDVVRGVPLVHFAAPSQGARLAWARRAGELALAASAFVLALPVMGLIALAIRLTSPGSAFFVQERIGVNRKPFRMFKFRTMYTSAEEALAQIEEFNESGGGLFKIRRDPRVTPVGRFLRRFSLDELPQLLNVMRGDMTLVGPRPLPRRDFEHYYEEWHYSRHSGKPGLTCLWQVSGRSDIDFHNMCILDVYYLRNQNWVLDLEILLKTFWVVLFAKGAY